MVPPSPVSSTIPTFRKIPGTYSEAEGDLESESWRRNGQLGHVSECRTSVGFSVTIVSRAMEPRQAKNHHWHRRSSLWLTIACELCDKITAGVTTASFIIKG